MVENILLATPRWTRDGGVGAHVQASAAALAHHGLRVAVLAARVDPGAAPRGVTVHHAPRLFDTAAPLDERLAGALSAAPPDVIHLHQLDEPALAAQLRAHAPLAVSAHAYTACASGVHYFRAGHECTRGHGPGCLVNFALRGCAHTRHPKTLPAKYRNAGRGLTTLAAADVAIAYSSAIERHLADNGIARRRVVPLFPTITPARASAHRHPRRVLFAGRVSAPKGLDVLLRAATHVEAELVVCGDGRQLPAMRRLARRLGIAQRVAFRGWLDAEELARELADAAIVALPSRWPEPFGLVGIEALAASRPVVASLTGGVRDWLTHDVTGLGVPPADPPALAQALAQLLDDAPRRQAMGEAGCEDVAARFSPERHVQALVEGYEQARSDWSHPRPSPAATSAV